jgi:BolA protein
MHTTKERIEDILQKNFSILQLEVVDDSPRHAKHMEAKKSGGKHFAITITAQEFEGKRLLERHKLIYSLLKNEFGSAVHALAIKAFSPSEIS